MDQPYGTREEAAAAFAAHVNRGKVRALEAIGVEIVVGEREGARFRDAYTGRWYWNCHLNGGVFSLGHRDPRLVGALRDALDELDVGNHHLVSGFRARLAARLSASTGDRCPFAVFAPSGSEAVDLALRLARAHTGRKTIVSARGAYHGLAGLAHSASDPRWAEQFGETPAACEHVAFGDREAIEAAVDETTAAVILETMPATLGFVIPPEGYLARVAEIAHERGGLLILDEVQTGLGRSGTVWCYEQDEVTPDVLITGKGLGGGLYPISAAMITDELEKFFDDNPFAYVSTFGGAELGCVVAGEVLEIVTEPAFLERVRRLGERFEQGFDGLGFELRRRGLVMGLKFPEEQGGVLAAKRLIDAGVFAVFAEHDHSVTQFKPPATLTDEEAEEIIAVAREALA